MTTFTPLDLIKSHAKKVKNEKVKHSKALEKIAMCNDFNDFHELQTVNESNQKDPRLLKAAFGISDLTQVLEENDHLLAELEILVEDQLSEFIASTNASGFFIDGLTVHDFSFGGRFGLVILEISFDYTGEPIPDKVFSATKLHVTSASLLLIFTDGVWTFDDEPLDIKNAESDQEIDWKQQEYFDEYGDSSRIEEIIAEELGITLEEAQELSDLEIHARETSDGLVVGYYIDMNDLENNVSKPLKKKLELNHSWPMIEFRSHIFDTEQSQYIDWP
ncbi:hypothetical protein [Larsenimonas suaedae]|uniref:Uncharacterized protein n=1 Tax=Larsenimonas suaedae TaxID=1851019 RepID=A0ABU1GZ28_9GAMM|nr:hypothetical protein [Larsenimonas suaedae]MCM2973783.1 hypothetical protein [Larsenimonas suaedae]MDR5897307.1 hypothetical protein [Larsenimonas suaedae]